MTSTRIVLGLAAALLVATTMPAHAATAVSAPVDGGDRLGSGVAIDGDWAAVGAPGDGAGAVHVFKHANGRWRWRQELHMPGGRSGDQFGSSVALSGRNLVAGAIGDDGARGSATFFRRSGSTWKLVNRVVGSERAKDDSFGNDASIWRDRAVIGAWHHGGKAFYGTPFTGAAYVFERVNGRWKQVKRLVGSDSQPADGFGTSVTVDRNRIAVGAWHQDPVQSNSGAVYVFNRDGGDWTERAKLVPADAGQFDHFGISVSMSGDTLLIGAWDDDDVAFNAGAAYVYVKADPPPAPEALDAVTGLLDDAAYQPWTMQAKLTASNGGAYDLFGGAVSLDGDRAVIGSLRDDDRGTNSGSAYVFERADVTWTQTKHLRPRRNSAGARLGESVAIDGVRVLAGAPRADEDGSNSGAAYAVTA